jgi:hypothetical protein
VTLRFIERKSKKDWGCDIVALQLTNLVRRKPRSRHIRHIRLQGDHNNNRMERLNGVVRDREKVMRGIKKINTSILLGYQMYHNYFRPHEGIGNVTPAIKCGIKIEDENKWVALIQNVKRDEKND